MAPRPRADRKRTSGLKGMGADTLLRDRQGEMKDSDAGAHDKEVKPTWNEFFVCFGEVFVFNVVLFNYSNELPKG